MPGWIQIAGEGATPCAKLSRRDLDRGDTDPWRNTSLHPVLKHGPRSLTCVRVLWVNPTARNEGEGSLGLLR